MARLFPNQLIGRVSPENARIYQAFRRIPGDQTQIWMALPSDTIWKPDWMILHEQRVCYLLAVSRFNRQGDLFGKKETVSLAPPGSLETERLKTFFEELTFAGIPFPAVYGAVLFPNLSQDFLDQIQEDTPNPDVALWGREMISPTIFKDALDQTLKGELFPAEWLDHLRHKFCPETRIPRDMIASPKSRRNLAPRHTRQLLDLDQEYLVKADLQMSDEANAAVGSQARLVTGVAGSGKTLILLYRAALQSKLDPGARILAVTHNRPLSFELRLRQEKIQPGTAIRWQTFYQWCDRLQYNRFPINYFDKILWINDLRSIIKTLQILPGEFVGAELDWIREQGFDDEQEYLTAPRTGRKRSLSVEKRVAMLELLTAYRQKLRSQEKTDWPDIAETVWLALQTGQIERPIFDHILVDEAQFFPPLWFKMMLFCREPERGTIFLAADPTQGFLKHRNSWRECGLEVRGHSTRLRKGYRNCREILAFATAFYHRRLPDRDVDNNLPEAADLQELPSGSAPEFIQVTHHQDESISVANEILQVVANGQTPANFLVLVKTSGNVKSFVEKIDRLHGSPIAWDAREPNQPAQSMIRVATLNSATGLESPVVFLCGIERLFDEEERLDLEAGEKEETIRNNTRQIYMALTRASRQLYIVHREDRTREILAGIADKQKPLSPETSLQTAAA